MSADSHLYVGSVMHRRLRPRAHKLRYRVFWLLLDLDDIGGLTKRLAPFSHNRFNAVSFHDRDHGDGSDAPLRPQIERHLGDAGIALSGGPIRLLCMPRIFGYGFNPISVYFCYRSDESLAAVLYEVHNTFGERHSYLFRVDDTAGDALSHSCDKAFYVSPFLDMAMRYAFRLVPPGERIAITIAGSDQDGPMIVAAMTGERKPLTNRSLLRVLAAMPFLTLKVISAIHWHALRLWLKGYKLRIRPPAPSTPVTVVNRASHP